MKRVTAIGFAQALAAARTAEEVDEVIRTRLAPVIDASGAILGIVDRPAGVLRLTLTDPIPAEIAARYERLPVDDAGPFTEVLRTGEALVLRGYDDWRRHAAAAVVDDAIAAGLETMACFPLIDRAGDVVAMLAVTWSGELDLDEAVLATMQTAVELCRDTLERAWATDRITEQARQLARLAELLADATTVDEALSIVTEHAPVPVGASSTSVGIVDDDIGVLRIHHGVEVSDDVREHYVDPPVDAELAVTEAARTGEPVYVTSYEEYRRRYPRAGAAIVTLGEGARAALPLRTAGGKMIGSVVLAWSSPQVFDTALASTLATIADMAGQAIERTWLLERTQRDAARSEALAAMAEQLATAHTGEQVARICANGAAPVVGADAANVALLDVSSGALQVHHDTSLDPELAARFITLSVDAAVPHVDVLQGGELLAFEDLDAFTPRYPHLVDDLKAAGRQACAVAPLTDSHGRRLGALGLAWSEPAVFDDACRASIQEVANLCAQALERTQQSDAEHRLVAELQRSVVRGLPPCARLDCAARHLPAARHIGMGGDWYQGLALDEHRYAVIVGDVAGHGITAVGYMAQLRSALAVLVTLGMPLSRVFSQVTELLRSGDRLVTATAVVAIVDTADGTLTYAAAGHPPPLLRRPSGEVVVLREGRQPLLGVTVAGADSVATSPFEPGATLVLYTDGLVERRHEPIDRSIERLTGHLRASTAEDAQATADELMASNLAAQDPDDDIAIVVVRHRG